MMETFVIALLRGGCVGFLWTIFAYDHLSGCDFWGGLIAACVLVSGLSSFQPRSR